MPIHSAIGSMSPSEKIEQIKTTTEMSELHRVELILRMAATVRFELKNHEDKLIFFWKERDLRQGTVLVQLKMPDIDPGKYILRVIADENEHYNQLLVKTSSH